MTAVTHTAPQRAITGDLPSVRLRATLAPFLPGLSRAGSAFWEHQDLRVLYPRYLVALHTVIRASVPLMRTALEVTRDRYLDLPCGPPLAAYLDKHIGEELWHDDWLLEDLDRLGVRPTAATRHIPSPAVAAMVGSQYYHIHHVHPAVFLGYIAVLEGYPPSEDLARFAADRTGYPITAFRTLRKHAHLDPQHCRDLDAALDAIPVDGTLHGMIRANALATLDYLKKLITEITDGCIASRLEHELAGP
ncbi:MAG TPA: iron-containing redox enzyme family protein [Streptosporangiaceae bacterium]|nr:iron-containing redox enzyme family protein [Streptosporangiaceae bacterium]